MEEPFKKKTKMTKEEKEKKEQKNHPHVHSVKEDSKLQKGKKAKGSKSKSCAFTENWKANEINLERDRDSLEEGDKESKEKKREKVAAFTENSKAKEVNLEEEKDSQEKKRKKVVAFIENSKAKEINLEKGNKDSKKKKRKKVAVAAELQCKITKDTPPINASAFQPIEPTEKTYPAADQNVPEGFKETIERQLFLKGFTDYVNELRIKLDWVDSDQIGVLHEQWRSFQVAESEARKRRQAMFNETLFKSTLKAFNSR